MRVQPLQRVTRGQLRGMPQRRGRAADAAMHRQVLAADHHAAEQQELGQRVAQQREVAAQRACVVRYGFEHAAAGRCTRQVGVVVGVAAHRLQLQGGVRLEEADRLVTACKECSHARVGIGFSATVAPQVVACRVEAVRQACLGHLVVCRDPHHAAGECRGAANAVGVLDQQHAPAERRGRAGSGHAGRARRRARRCRRCRALPTWQRQSSPSFRLLGAPPFERPRQQRRPNGTRRARTCRTASSGTAPSPRRGARTASASAARCRARASARGR